MERLVDITCVMNYETQGERLAVLLNIEGVCNLLVISSLLVVTAVQQIVSKGSHGIDTVCVTYVKLGEIFNGFTSLVNVWSIDKVPGRLPGVALALNDVGKGSTLNKRIILLVSRDRGIMALKGFQHLVRCLQRIWVVGLKDIIRASCGQQVTIRPIKS